MFDFDLFNPTHLMFGKNRIEALPKVLSNYGKNVLFAMGGGSIKKIGLYDKVKTLLKDFNLIELSGIEPNPKIGSVRRGVELCKQHQIDVVLAVGGGSVLDACKNICAGACYDGDPWDLVLDASKVEKALPMVAVLTLSATGSEFDGGGVISNPETNEKMAIMKGGVLDPRVSICDPQYTFSVPPSQIAAGAADIMSHTFEQYLVKEGNILTDAMCEGMLRSVIENTRKVLKDPNDYNARAELMMTSSFGCSGHLAMGRTPSPWFCHGIEHEISAYTDITHGYGLAIITPHWMRYSLNEDTAARFAQYGVKVFGLDPKAPDMENANKAIDMTAEFFKEIGIPSKLSDLGVTDEHFEEMAEHVTKIWWSFENAIVPLDKQAVVDILKASL